MIDDIGGPGRRKPKIIQPLPRQDSSLPHFEELPAHEIGEVAADKGPSATTLEHPLRSPKAKENASDAIDLHAEATEEFPGIKDDPPHHNYDLPETTEQLLPAHTTSHRKWYLLDWPPSRREWLVSAALLVVALIVLSGYVYANRPTGYADIVVTVNNPKVVPKTVPSTLTGLPVDPSVNKRPITGVMIENSLDARPQSGLDQAGVVFEAIAEGGITRFLALYQDNQPSYLGPVRSARPYFVQWALGFDAGYAHVGGSPEALQDIKNWHVRDLDQFFNSGAYHRITSRYAPHNMYTSIASLQALEKAKGYTTSSFTGFDRNQKVTPATKPAATSIDFDISGYNYNVHYAYDKKSNTYKRSEGSQPHYELDAKGHKTQIAPTVVIGIVVPYRLESDGYHSYYNVLGSGTAEIFQGGNVIKGVWHKPSKTGQLSFTDATGKPLKLDPGQTWITALGQASEISYKP